MSDPIVSIVNYTEEEINEAIGKALDGAVVKVSATEPMDTTVLWLKTTDNTFRYYDNGSWVAIMSPSSPVEISFGETPSPTARLWIGPNGLYYRYTNFWIQA